MDKLHKVTRTGGAFVKKIAAAAAIFTALLAAALPACGGGEQGGEEVSEGTYMQINLSTQNGSCSVELAGTEAARQLYSRLEGGDITFNADDYGGFEKVGSPGFSLPASDVRLTAAPGDIMLYQGNSIVIFYGSNTWAYTRIGSVLNVSAEGLAHLLGAGQGSISVTLSVE